MCGGMFSNHSLYYTFIADVRERIYENAQHLIQLWKT